MGEYHSREQAIVELYVLHSEDICRFARSNLPSFVDPQDVVQEVFLRAYKSFPQFERRSMVKTWLYSIARNHIYDLLRRQRSDRRHLSCNSIDDLVIYQDVDTASQFMEVLSKLTPVQRVIITLRVIDGLSVKEVAAKLGRTEQNVRVVYFRAKRLLRQEMTKEVVSGNKNV